MSFIDNVIGSFAASNPIGGLLSAAGSIFGGLFGKKGQDQANATNLQIARETNEANRANQEYQNEWNLDMWNRQNDYNSPLEQRKRLEQAGLNPIFFGLDGTGNAGALQSAPFQAQIGAPMLNSGQFMGAGLANAISNYANTSKTLADAGNAGEDTISKRLQNALTRATFGTKVKVGNFEFELTKANYYNIKQNTAESAKRIEQLGAIINNINTQTEYIPKNFELQDYIAKVDERYKNAQTAIAQANLDFQQKKWSEELLLRTKELEIALMEARTNKRKVDLEERKYHDYFYNEYGLDLQIKKGELFCTIANHGKLSYERVKTLVETYKIGREALYGDKLGALVVQLIESGVPMTFDLDSDLFINTELGVSYDALQQYDTNYQPVSTYVPPKD